MIEFFLRFLWNVAAIVPWSVGNGEARTVIAHDIEEEGYERVHQIVMPFLAETRHLRDEMLRAVMREEHLALLDQMAYRRQSFPFVLSVGRQPHGGEVERFQVINDRFLISDFLNDEFCTPPPNIFERLTAHSTVAGKSIRAFTGFGKMYTSSLSR
jgi:hypothetical protein